MDDSPSARSIESGRASGSDCDVPAYPVDWARGGRLRAGPDDAACAELPQQIQPGCRLGSALPLRRIADGLRLLRSDSLVAPTESAGNSALISELPEISAFLVVPVHDARHGHAPGLCSR